MPSLAAGPLNAADWPRSMVLEVTPGTWAIAGARTLQAAVTASRRLIFISPSANRCALLPAGRITTPRFDCAFGARRPDYCKGVALGRKEAARNVVLRCIKLFAAPRSAPYSAKNSFTFAIQDFARGLWRSL